MRFSRLPFRKVCSECVEIGKRDERSFQLFVALLHRRVVVVVGDVVGGVLFGVVGVVDADFDVAVGTAQILLG